MREGVREDRREMEVVREGNSRARAAIMASDCQLWQQTERRIIVSSRV